MARRNALTDGIKNRSVEPTNDQIISTMKLAAAENGSWMLELDPGLKDFDLELEWKWQTQKSADKPAQPS